MSVGEMVDVADDDDDRSSIPNKIDYGNEHHDDDDDHEEVDPLKISVTERGAAHLMKVLLERGYFDPSTTTATTNKEETLNEKGQDDVCRTTTKKNSDLMIVECKQCSSDNPNYSDSSTVFLTRDQLDRNLREELQSRGRLSIEDACLVFRIAHDKEASCIRRQNANSILQQSFQRIAQTIQSDTTVVPRDPSTILLLNSGNECSTVHHIVTVLAPMVASHVSSCPNGKFSLDHLSHDILHFPVEETLYLLEQYILPALKNKSIDTKDDEKDSVIHIRKQRAGGTVLVTQKSLDQLQCEVHRELISASQPVSLERLCRDRHWDMGWVVEIIEASLASESNNDRLNGQLRGDTFVPYSYMQEQRDHVLDLFKTNGFVTLDQCQSMGTSSAAQIKAIVMTHYNDETSSGDDPFLSSSSSSSSVVLSLGENAGEDFALVHSDLLIAPLEALLAETVAGGTWLNLQNHIPPEILLKQDLAETLLHKFVLPRLNRGDETRANNIDINQINVGTKDEATEDDSGTVTAFHKKDLRKGAKSKNKGKATQKSSPGVAIISAEQGEALFISRAMIDKISTELLPSLVESFAKEKAKQLGQDGGASSEKVSSQGQSAKEKRKQKQQKATKGRKQQQAQDADEVEDAEDNIFKSDFVPLDDIVEVVVKAYPELATYCNENASTKVRDSSQQTNQNLLSRLCEEAFYTESFQSTCINAVQAELRRLESDRASKSRVSRKDAASKVQTVEVAFEDPSCFATACYMLQSMAAFIEYASEVIQSEDVGVDGEKIEELKKDFLRSCCTDFTTRLTQYCLFKNEVDELMFSFDNELCTAVLVPNYCSPVDIAARHYSQPFVHCRFLDDDGQPLDTLQALRNALPATVGVPLARQWKLCGYECYQGISQRPGDLAGFLSHVEENSLTICGLPFKKLDKKTKKQLLHTRRQQLLQKLQEETDPASILDLTIMILYQYVKNQIVFGSHLRDPVLAILKRERKVSEEISMALTELANEIEAGKNEIDPDLIQRVKGCCIH